MKKLKKKKEKLDINRVYKAFAIATAIGTILGEVNKGDPKLSGIFVQCSRAMAVFRKEIGESKYLEVADKASSAWGDVCKAVPVTPFPHEASTVAAIIYSLMKPSEMKVFLNMQIVSDGNIRNKNKSSWISFAREFNIILNEIFSVHDDFNRNKIGKIISPTIKATPVKKEKQKRLTTQEKLEQKKARTNKRINQNIKKKEEQYSSNLGILREMAERARAKNVLKKEIA